MSFQNEPDENKGSLLAKGKGIFSMGDISYKRGYSNQNTVLEVKNPNDLDSEWKIYRRKDTKNIDTTGWKH